MPGSFEILNYLRSQKKNLYFITNSSLRGREELAKKFSKFNFKVDIEEVSNKICSVSQVHIFQCSI